MNTAVIITKTEPNVKKEAQLLATREKMLFPAQDHFQKAIDKTIEIIVNKLHAGGLKEFNALMREAMKELDRKVGPVKRNPRRSKIALEESGKFPAVSTVSSEGRMRLFKREYSRIKKEKTITGDAAVAMRKALGFEAEGREMYTRMSENASNRQEKAFFRILASEEQKHFDIIYEYLDFLENAGLRMGE